MLSLPAVSIVEQWESHVAKVGGKVFALLNGEGMDASVSFKVTEISFDGLTGIEGIGQAPYFARRHWVAVSRGAVLPTADLRAYIAQSHGLVAAKLTKKTRVALGL